MLILKKRIYLIAILLFLRNSLCLASPITEQLEGESTIGLMTNGHFYLETAATNNKVVGLQHISDKTEFYMQNLIDNKFRAIIGIRVTNSQESTFYAGAAAMNSLNDNLNDYASLIVGSGFHELEIGVNYTLSYNSYINLNCQFPADNKNKSNLNIGLITKI